MSRHIIPYRLYRWFADQVIGRVLLYGYKREMERGDIHEARHLATGLQTGNSEGCTSANCRLDARPVAVTVPAYPGIAPSGTKDGNPKK